MAILNKYILNSSKAFTFYTITHIINTAAFTADIFMQFPQQKLTFFTQSKLTALSLIKHVVPK
jgi:hypothetical protein